MARISSARLLDAGDTFPALDLTLTNGERFALPSSFTQAYNVALVNRGAWCPYCSAQLSAFQSQAAAFDHEGIGIVSVSADSLDSARSVVAKHGLSFPVGYGASVETIAEALGAYCDPRTHARPLAATAVREGLTRDEAIDAVQEAFETLLSLRQARELSLDDDGAARLMAVLVRNAARNQRRRHYRSRPHDAIDDTHLAADLPDVETLIADAERHVALLGCVNQLATVRR